MPRNRLKSDEMLRYLSEAGNWEIYGESMTPSVDYRVSDKPRQFTDSEEGVVVDFPWEEGAEASVTIATTGPEVIYDAGVYERLSRIEENIREVKAMLQEIYHMGNPDDEILELRDISRDQAKKEIAAYFEDHHGETFNEADLQEALKISIWMIIDVCTELEAEGEVRGI